MYRQVTWRVLFSLLLDYTQEDSPSEHIKETSPANTLMLEAQLPELQGNMFLLVRCMVLS